MRGNFLKALLAAAAVDERVWLVAAEDALPEVERFGERFPERILAAGVDGAATIGLAAGLAASGKTVFVYAPAGIAAIAAVARVRDDVCAPGAAVIVVTAGAGYDLSGHGPPHHATNDLALFRALPGTAVVAPGDGVEAELLTAALAAAGRPAYLRLALSRQPPVHRQPPPLVLGRALRLRDGADVTFVVCGALLPHVLRVAAVVARLGFDPRVLSMPTVKPVDRTELESAARETRAIVTVEDHSTEGGLGSAVCEAVGGMFRTGIVPVVRVGLEPGFSEVTGSRDYLMERAGLSVSGILDAVKDVLEYVRGRQS